MNLGPILSFIRRLEARGSYDTVWGGIRSKDYPPRPLTKMSVGEVLAWQKTIRAKGYRSTACGGYQFIYPTLSKLVSSMKIPPETRFDFSLQDRLAERLMVGRGLTKYVAGQKSLQDFCNDLAKEWASLPVVTPVKRTAKDKTWTVPVGASYYSGDGLNKALTPIEPFLAAVRAITAKSVTPPPLPASPKGNPLGWLIGLGLGGLAVWWADLWAHIQQLFGG